MASEQLQKIIEDSPRMKSELGIWIYSQYLYSLYDFYNEPFKEQIIILLQYLGYSMRYNEKVNEYLYLETIKRYIYLYENSFNFKPVVMEPAPLDFKGLSLKDALSAYFPKIKLPSLSDALIDCIIKRPVMVEEIKEVKLYYKPSLEALPF